MIAIIRGLHELFKITLLLSRLVPTFPVPYSLSVLIYRDRRLGQECLRGQRSLSP